jgi:CRISPR-associated protein Csb2
LRQIEALPPPAISASEEVHRSVLTHFVPVNDTAIVGGSSYERRYARLVQAREARWQAVSAGSDKATRSAESKMAKQRDIASQVEGAGRTNMQTALRLLPANRGKQARTYPSVTPFVPRVTLIWQGAEIETADVAILDELLMRVTRLGHSSSLVSCRVESHPSKETMRPVVSGTVRLRTTGPGQLDALRDAHRLHQGQRPRSLPSFSTAYAGIEEDARVVTPDQSDLAGRLVVYSTTRTVDLAATFRAALQSTADDPVPTVLSGHEADGAPTGRPHAAFLALPFTGHEHANGLVMGMAVLLPTSIPEDDERLLLRALGHWESGGGELHMGRAGTLPLERVVRRAPRQTVNPATWSATSHEWVTVTPIALPRHPGALWSGTASRMLKARAQAESTIADACEHIDLPRPAGIEVRADPFLTGAAPVRSFPPFVQGKGERRNRRALVHARIIFDRPIIGPVVLGSGRYFGLGLCRPSPRTAGRAQS